MSSDQTTDALDLPELYRVGKNAVDIVDVPELWPLDDRQCWGRTPPGFPEAVAGAVPGSPWRAFPAEEVLGRRPPKDAARGIVMGRRPGAARHHRCGGDRQRRHGRLRPRSLAMAGGCATNAGKKAAARTPCASVRMLPRTPRSRGWLSTPGPPRRDLPGCPSAQSPEKLRTILRHPIAPGGPGT